MRRIIAIGAPKPPVLPGYKVGLDVLDDGDVIKPGDLLLVGNRETSYHDWTRISFDSPMMGMKMSLAKQACCTELLVARRADEGD